MSHFEFKFDFKTEIYILVIFVVVDAMDQQLNRKRRTRVNPIKGNKS
jgi:hypothetical protein